MSLLARKYAILQQEADTHLLEAQNRAEVTRAQAGAIPIETNANAALANANAYRVGREGANVDRLATSAIGAQRAQSGFLGAQTQRENAPFNTQAYDPYELRRQFFMNQGHYSERAVQGGGAPANPLGVSTEVGQPIGAQSTDDGGANRNPQTYSQYGFGSTPSPSLPSYTPAQIIRGTDGFSRGTPQVPGRGDGTVDTVPAMLAPGEAVLNKGAAEHMGRGMIAQINKLGLAKMAANDTPAAKSAKGKGMCKGGMVSYAMGIDEVLATPATQPTPATRGGLQQRPQMHAAGTANVESSAQPNPTTGDATSPKDRAAALAADPIDRNDLIAIHHPSLMMGIQMATMAKGMPKARAHA